MLKNNYLIKLQKKCNLNDSFIKTINLLFEKLINFGYISKLDINKLSKKLYNNINLVIIGKKNDLDYKSGYYDATKKEVYFKDITNTSAIFLRLLYILTTKENSNESLISGYSKISKSVKSYKIDYTFFGLNRAIISNIVCRLLYTLPESLSLIPTYRTYQNNFLGTNFTSNNDIYFLEGKLLRQICYIYNIHEEELYYTLFNNKKNKLKVFLKNNLEELLLILDNISRNYSNYNKLCYFNKLLNDNYLKIKKSSIKNDKLTTNLKTNKNNIIRTIKTVINKINSSSKNINDDVLETNLNETLDNLEELLISDISKLQSKLIAHYIKNKYTLSPIEYVKNLKTIESMLVIKSDVLTNEIFNNIKNNIIQTDEKSCTNLVSKIKFSLSNYMLGKDKYTKLFEGLNFKIIKEINKNDDDICIIINSGVFNEIAYVNNLSSNMKQLSNNIEFIQSKNLKYLLNTNTNKNQIIEKLYTSLISQFKEFKDVLINNIYMYNANTETLLLVITNTNAHIVLLQNEYNVLNEQQTENFKFKLLNLSENYNIIPNHSNLPTLYKKNNLSKLFNLFKK